MYTQKNKIIRYKWKGQQITAMEKKTKIKQKETRVAKEGCHFDRK